MNRRLDLLAGAVILAGATALSDPGTAHATYFNPWTHPDGGTLYCCRTPPTAQCCSTTGCMTREGICLVVR